MISDLRDSIDQLRASSRGDTEDAGVTQHDWA
jgi:hypothetical protein